MRPRRASPASGSVVNPKDGSLYVLEGDGAIYKSTLECLRIDPATGKVTPFEFPYDCEDLAFDLDGLAYLRAWNAVGRYDPGGQPTWREVPWDYGEERAAVNHNNESGAQRRAPLTAGLIVPVGRYNHQGGLFIAPTGHIVVCSYFAKQEIKLRNEYPTAQSAAAGQPYKFPLYPGRPTFALIDIWDQHGKLLSADAVRGLSFTYGIGLDRDDGIYALASGTRVNPTDSQPYFNPQTGTLMKFPFNARQPPPFLSTHKDVPLALAKEDWPNRPPDLVGDGGARLGRAWVEGAEWFYGGVGFHGRSNISPGYGCDCWNCRFALDYFARSFAPEIDHKSVAVLDSSGNLILRVGQYGNVDDGAPIVKDGGPARTHALGGDEVAIFYAPYVATHTDHRLFIADPGNARIVSVKLDYHRTETVPLGSQEPKLPAP